MTLVVWNQTLTEGIGRTGTRYTVSRLDTKGRNSAGWLVTVDAEQLYMADDAVSAAIRAEHLEALRCVLIGFTGELTDGELDRAIAVAEEMSLSALRTIGRSELTDDQRRDVEESLDRLRKAREEIVLIRRGRARPFPHALH